MSLFSQISLTFTRYGEQTVNDDGYVVKGAESTIETVGALQPLRFGDTSVVLQQGINPKASKIFYTKTRLRNADTYDETPADECVIDGKTYIVFDAGDWTTNDSPLAHYKVILVRKEAV